MKKSKVFKLVLVILICILIILIGFFGIYVKKNNSYKNLLSDYTLAPDLKGATVLEFKVSTDTQDEYYDGEGNKVDSSIITDDNEDEYTKKEVSINNPENLNEDNYNKVVDIMQERLKFLKADQYNIDLDKKTGKIVLTFEDEYPDDIKSILPMEGKMNLIDSNTSDIIIDYTDFNSAEATYASTEDGYTTYINLKLNSSGMEKIKNIDKYKANTENTEETSEENSSNTDESNKFKVMFDSDEIAEVEYDNIVLTGKNLRITTAENITSSSTIQSKMNTNTVVSKLATIGKTPVVYEIEAEEYIRNNSENYIPYITIALIIICVGISIFFLIKYKRNGLLAILAFATNIALFLIIIRLTKIPFSLNGFAAIFGLILLNTILLNNILKQIQDKEKTFSENVKQAYLKTIDAFVVTLILYTVFAFSRMTVINSMGLLMFWGWLIILLGNLALTVPMLSIVNKK